MSLTQEHLKTQLRYEPTTGLFFWLENRNGRQVDKPVGSRTGTYGTNRISLDGIQYNASKLAWFYMTDIWIKHVGFKDFNPINLKFDNLIELSEVEYKKQRRALSPHVNTFRGVAKDHVNGTWFVQRLVGGKVEKGPYFNDPMEAVEYWTELDSKHTLRKRPTKTNTPKAIRGKARFSESDVQQVIQNYENR